MGHQAQYLLTPGQGMLARAQFLVVTDEHALDVVIEEASHELAGGVDATESPRELKRTFG